MVKHLLDKFHVITIVSNPVRYRSRYALYREFERRMKEKGANLWTVEMQTGDRSHQVSQFDNDRHLQLRSFEELWHKENMINVGIQRLPSDWEYVAWIDADVRFLRDDWIEETIHQLQHYMVVQMWENAIDLGPTGQTISQHVSFVKQYLDGKPYCYGGPRPHYYAMWHPGFAWAARREAIDHLGGLIDTAILGAGDNHMAHALVGRVDETMADGLTDAYKNQVRVWQERSERFIRRDVGIVPGSIVHDWHGKKKDRKYHDRWKILVDRKYNPETDIKRDYQGLYQLQDHGDLRSIGLRDDIRKYFRARNEDSIDLY